MKSKMYLVNPDEVEATVEITMKIKEFQAYLDATKDVHAWPTWQVREVISRIVHKAKLNLAEIMEFKA